MNIFLSHIFQFGLKLLDSRDLLRVENKFLVPKTNIPVKIRSALNHERVPGGGQGTDGPWNSRCSYLAQVLRPLLLPWRSRSPALCTPRWLTPGSSYRRKPFPTPHFSALQLVLRQCWLLLSTSPVVAGRDRQKWCYHCLGTKHPFFTALIYGMWLQASCGPKIITLRHLKTTTT